MSNGWEWQSFTGSNKNFHAQKGFFTLVVSLDADSAEWSGTAFIASPAEDETGGVIVPCEGLFASKEEAQDAAISALRGFVEKLHADL